MSAKKDEVIHVYDGIQECDNALPKWWLYILYISIAFAFWYVGYYFAFQSSFDEKLGQEFNSRSWSTAMLEKDIRENTVVENTDYATMSGAELEAVLSKPDLIAVGATIYKAKCAVCHGNDGQGVVGPNLTDKFWIHGGSADNIKQTLLNGVAAAGMPAWKGVITDKNIVGAIAYIRSIQGTNPANPKAPQGDEYVPGESPAPTVTPAAEAAPVTSVTDEASKESTLEEAPKAEAISGVDGKAIFATNCVACHGPDGGGTIGPNLTDDVWIHGSDKIVEVITNGVLEKGMLAWGPVLKPEEITAVADYVRSLKGTTPANPKAPQGDLK